MKSYIIQENCGQHIHHGITYRCGEVVNSNMDMIALFGKKFKLAPKGIVGDKWPMDIPDAPDETDKRHVCAMHNSLGYRVIGEDGTVVEGCDKMKLKDAIAKYRELFATKAAKVSKVIKPEVDDEEEEEPEVDAEEEEQEEQEEQEVQTRKVNRKKKKVRK